MYVGSFQILLRLRIYMGENAFVYVLIFAYCFPKICLSKSKTEIYIFILRFYWTCHPKKERGQKPDIPLAIKG